MEFENIIKMYEETYHKISSSSKEWENFLRCACRNYKLRFDEQVLLYAQAPNATKVELFNADYPLIPEEMERDVFDKRVRENFRNEHLLVEVAEPKYDDAFFIKDNGNIIWIYYNPDSDAGGQYVTNNFTVEDINEASSKFNEPEAFFDYIGMVSKQNLSDVGTEWFTEAETQFLQIPDFTNLTLDTMNSLVEYSLKEQNHSIAEKLVEAVQDIDYYEYLDNLDSGETEEDVIKNIAERITDENYAEGVIDYLQKAEDDRLAEAKELIDEYCREEFERDEGADYTNLAEVNLAYTETEDLKHEIQVNIDLIEYKLNTLVDGKTIRSEEYNSLEELTEYVLKNLSFDELVFLSDKELLKIEQSDALLNVDKTENEIISEDASEDETVEESISQVPAQDQGVGMTM